MNNAGAPEKYEGLLDNTHAPGRSQRTGTQLLNSELSSNSLAYVRVIRNHTGFRLHQTQRLLLKENLKSTSYSRLTSAEGRVHRRAFSKRVKDTQIRLWENNTGQAWPRYSEDLLNAQGKVLRKAGDPLMLTMLSRIFMVAHMSGGI